MNKLYINYAALEQHVQSIIRDIEQSDWKPDYIVGLTRGGLLPATLISQYTGISMCSLDVSLRDGTMEPTSNCWMAEDALDGKNILVVDDINDTGATLQWIVDDWMASNMPQNPEWEKVFAHNVRFACVVDNESSNFTNVSYSSMEINKAVDDVWIVFPWEDWFAPKPD